MGPGAGGGGGGIPGAIGTPPGKPVNPKDFSKPTFKLVPVKGVRNVNEVY